MASRVALLIATYDYRDTGLRQLRAPAHDVEALAEVLQASDIAGFEVTTLINEPHYRVGEAIADLYRDRRRDDVTLLYFTGHGLKDGDGRLYLAMTNTQRGSLLFTSLPAEQIDQAMSDCNSRQKVLILDCCYSGAFPAGTIAKADSGVQTLERFQGRGRIVLTASDSLEYSFEGNQLGGTATQSVFSRHLVAGLRDGSADLDGDGNITIDELYSYVHDRVVEERPEQRPKKQDNVEGRIVIARNINWTLPAYLQHALDSPIAAQRLTALDGLVNLYRIGAQHVRRQVVSQIHRLLNDDSRSVSTAAAVHLEALGSPESGLATNPTPGSNSVPEVPEPVPEAAVTSPGAGAGDPQRVKALIGLSELAAETGNLGEARRLLLQAIETGGDPRQTVNATMSLGWIEKEAGDLDQARRLFQQAIETGDPWQKAKALLCLGIVENQAGNRKEARSLWKRTIETGQPSLLPAAWTNLALTEWDDGNQEEARRLFQQAIDAGHQSGYPEEVAVALNFWADRERSARKGERASQLYKQVLDVKEPATEPGN